MDFEGSHLLIEKFGKWPSFHDSEIRRLALATPKIHGDLASLEMVVHCWELSSDIDETGHYILRNHTLVTFAFEHLENITIKNFNHQNSIDSLEFEQLALEAPGVVAWRISTNPSFGVELDLSCQKIRVISAVSCDDKGKVEV